MICLEPSFITLNSLQDGNYAYYNKSRSTVDPPKGRMFVWTFNVYGPLFPLCKTNVD